MIQNAPAVDAYAIYLQTRSAVTRAQYPRRLNYTIAVSGLDGDQPRENHYRASTDPSDGTIRLFPISDEELASPPHPHGFHFTIQGYDVSIGGRQPTADVLGVPMLAPTYMFGLTYPRPHDPTPLEESRHGAPPTIAVVSTTTRDYAVTLLDQPDLDGVATYHLGLKPLRNPGANRLRELWVGEEDSLPRRAVVAGNFTLPPLDTVPWTVDFALLNDTPVIADERADATLYLPHRRVVRDAEIAFENVREPNGSLVGGPLVQPNLTEDTLVEP